MGKVLSARSPTYRVFTAAYAPSYSNPTDIFGIIGSNSKIIVPLTFALLIRSTSATLLPVDFVRRSTLNTGGSPATLTKMKDDLSDPDPSASLVSYAAAPSGLGTTLGIYSSHELSTTALTAAPATFTFGSTIGIPSNINFQKPVILRGASDGLYANLRGGSFPSGFSAYLVAQWIEY